MEGPLLAPTPHMAKTAAEPEGSWSWFVDASHDGRPSEGGDAVAPGLRAAVAEGGASAGRERTYVLLEGDPTPIPVGRVRDPHAHGFAVPAGAPWDAGETSVEWWVCSRRRGTCAVAVEAVPHLVHPCGSDLVLHHLAVSRVIAVGDALVLSAEPGSSLPGVLVGEDGGRGGRLVLRIR
jgi:hypothetical protein